MDFVLHKSPNNEENHLPLTIPHSADIDIIAIRMPHVSEEIGGFPDDWDPKWEDWKIKLSEKMVGLIVEVKSGKHGYNIPAFQKNRLTNSIKRIGCFEESIIEEFIEEFLQNPIFERDKWVLGKLLITVKKYNPTKCIRLDLKGANDFIISRIEKYQDPKMSDRIFFPDDLFQYMIWHQKEYPNVSNSS